MKSPLNTFNYLQIPSNTFKTTQNPPKNHPESTQRPPKSAKKLEKTQKNAFFVKFFSKKFGGKEKMSTFAIPNENNTFEKQKSGAIAQLVEQRTENPCVPGSIPGGTTENLNRRNSVEVFSL